MKKSTKSEVVVCAAIGLDVSDKKSAAMGVDEAGNVALRELVPTRAPEMMKWASSLTPTLIALEAMMDWLQTQHGLSRPHALGLASLAVDFRITQIVNGVRGVHAILPHSFLH